MPVVKTVYVYLEFEGHRHHQLPNARSFIKENMKPRSYSMRRDIALQEVGASREPNPSLSSSGSHGRSRDIEIPTPMQPELAFPIKIRARNWRAQLTFEFSWPLQKLSAVTAVVLAMGNISLKHFSGFHASMDMRSAIPQPFLAYYPTLVKQSDIDEAINFLDGAGNITSFSTGHPPRYEELGTRDNYDPKDPQAYDSNTRQLRLGDFALGRSGDKGGNLNVGFFPTNHAHWPWLRDYMTKDRMRQLIGDDWHDSFFIERVEFPHTHAVHLVIYSILGRGVSSSSRLDGFGKGFADYVRDKCVEVPVDLL